MEILNERPAGMSFGKYRAHLKKQSQWIKRRKKGITIWNSNGIPNLDMEGKLIGFIKQPEGTATRRQLNKRCKQLNISAKLKEYAW